MKCKECKTKIMKKSDFCPYCGAQIADKHIINEGFVDINIILDKSGSMITNKETTIKEFNSYLLEQAQVNGKATISLYIFNHKYEIIYEDIEVKKAPALTKDTYTPEGTTALLDAIGKTISRKDSYYASLKNKPSKILFVIITDGLENASTEFSKSNIRKIIEDKQSNDWDFAFIGAGIDAFSDKSAGGYSIISKGIMNVANNSDGFSHAFSSLSSATSRHRASSVKTRFAFGDDNEPTF